jgi:hypothetical protein
MPNLTPTEAAWLRDLARRVAATMDSAWDAYETGLMSDAKSDVSALADHVQANTVLPAALTAALLPLFTAAKEGIQYSSTGTAEQRAMRAHHALGVAGRQLAALLAGDGGA